MVQQMANGCVDVFPYGVFFHSPADVGRIYRYHGGFSTSGVPGGASRSGMLFLVLRTPTTFTPCSWFSIFDDVPLSLYIVKVGNAVSELC